MRLSAQVQSPDVDDPLVGTSPEIERQIAQRLDIAAVDQRVDPPQTLPPGRVGETFLKRITRIAPDVLSRALLHQPQEGSHGFGPQQRIAAAERHAVENRIRGDRGTDGFGTLPGQWLAPPGIVAFGVVAAGTTVRAPREIDRIAQPVTVGDGFGIDGQDAE